MLLHYEVSYDTILTEFVNDDIGRLIADGEALNQFIEENKSDRTLLQRVADALRALWQKLTGKDRQQVKTAEEALLAALKTTADQAHKLEQAGKVGDFAQESEGGEYSIGYDVNNTPFVTVETDILEGVPESEWVSKVRENLFEKFPNGVTVARSQIKINAQTRSELTSSEYSKWLRDHTPEIFADKLRATDQVDEILQATRGYVDEAPKHARKDNIEEFARGVVQLKVGSNDYIADVVVGTTKGGSMVLYDLVDLKPTEIKTKQARAASTPQTRIEDRTLKPVSGSTVAQETPEVKADYSLREDGRAKVAALKRENQDLRAKYEYWKKQTARSEAGKVSEEETGKYVRDLAQQLGTKVDTKRMTMRLLALYDSIGTGHDADGGDFTFQDADRLAMDIAGELVGQAVEVSDGLYEQYADLRAHLRRDVAIVVDAETRAGITDYADFRNRNMGRLRLKNGETGNVDQVYHDLTQQWPELFDSEVMAEEDQLVRIADMMAYIYRREEFNPYSADMEGMTREVANELLEHFWDTPGVKPTYADRQWRARQELRRQHVEDVRLKVQAERERGKVQQQKLKDWYAQRDAENRAYKSESEARNRLLKVSRRLKTIAKHSDNVTRGKIQELIGELDTEARHLTGKKLNELTQLRQWYQDKTTEGSDSYDPDFIPDAKTLDALDRLERKHIDDMDLQDVKDLTDALLNIEHETRTAKRLIGEEEARNTYQLAEQTIKDIRATRGSKTTGVGGALDKFIVTETLSPIRQVRRMVGYKADSPLLKATEALAAGQKKMMTYQMEAEKPFQKFAQDKAFNRDFSGKNAKTVKVLGMVDGKSAQVEVTRAMLVSLWLHSQNDQNALHMKDGGVRVPDMALYRKGKMADAYAAGTVMKVSPSVAKGLWGMMTSTERAFAKATQDYFGKVSQSAINEVSRQLKGYDIAEVENYYPIHTDKTFGRSELETLKFDGTIEGMGFLKERMNHAHSPMMLEDVNSVLDQAMRMHGKYVGLAIPVRNFGKIWNVSTALRVESEGGTVNPGGQVQWSSYGDSVQNAVQAVWGKTGYNYLTKLLTDLQGGGKEAPAWAKTLGKVRSNYAGAVLTLNASVAMKQAASYPTAAAVLGWKPLMRAMRQMGPVDQNLIAKYTPLQWYRSQGFSTKELGDIAKTDGVMQKVLNVKGLNWVQGMDLLTTRKLWKASEFYVRDQSPTLKIGSEEYYKAVAEVYDRVIEETQPNYTTMERPQLLRSDDSLMGNLAMFKTQPFQNFNILYDAAGEYRATVERAKTGEASRAEVKAARAKLSRAVTSQVAQLAVFAGMTAAWAFFRGRTDKYKDEEGETDLWSILGGVSKDIFGGVASMVPFGTEVWEFTSSKIFDERYYGMEPVAIESISNTVTSLGKLCDMVWETAQKVIAGEEVEWEDNAYLLDDVADDVSKLVGVPYENVINLFSGFARWVCVGTQGKYRGEYAVLHLTTNAEKNQAAYNELYAQMVQDGFDVKKIKSAMESRLKKAQGVSKVTELEERFVAPENEDIMDRAIARLRDSDLWDDATEDQQDKAEALAYKLVTNESESVVAQVEKLEAAGVDPGTWALYKLAVEMADAANDANKSYTKAEKEEAIGSMDGLTDAERAALWELAGGSKKTNPWG